MIQSVIFDLDGVILESAQIKTEAFLELFNAYPQHRAAIYKFHFENLGVSRFKKFEWIYRELLGQALSQEEKDSLSERFSGLVLEKVLRCPFIPGALETFQALTGKYLMFVASGTPQAELEYIVRERGIASYFEQVFGSPAEKAEAVREILQRLQLQPRDALFVGDGLSDYRAAAETGIRFIAVDSPEMHDDWLQLNVECVTDLRDFQRFLTVS